MTVQAARRDTSEPPPPSAGPAVVNPALDPKTALASAAFGFGLVGVFRTIGMLGAVPAAVSHWFSLRKLGRGEPLSAYRWPSAITAAVVVAMLGLYALWAVATA
jgi:hypothetical protein